MFELQYNKYVFWVNLLTPRNYEHVTSLYNIILFQEKQVKRILKPIKLKLFSWPTVTPNSQLIYKEMCSGSARSRGELTIRLRELQGSQIHVWHMQELWNST